MQERRGKATQVDLPALQDVLLDRSAGNNLGRDRLSTTSLYQGFDNHAPVRVWRQSHGESNPRKGQSSPRVYTTWSPQHSEAFLNALDVLEQRRGGTGFIAPSTDRANLKIQVHFRRNPLKVSNRFEFDDEVAQAFEMSHEVMDMRTRVTCWVLRVIG